MATATELNRRQFVPLWIKVFGWLFIVMGVVIPAIPIVSMVTQQPARFEMFGLSHVGSPFHPMALLVMAIIASLSVSAFGLLFGKAWGLKACLATGYGGIAICLGTMLLSILGGDGFTLRLELLLQVPYVIALGKIRSRWMAGADEAAAAPVTAG